jgi:hypothetical protein
MPRVMSLIWMFMTDRDSQATEVPSIWSERKGSDFLIIGVTMFGVPFSAIPGIVADVQ